MTDLDTLRIGVISHPGSVIRIHPGHAHRLTAAPFTECICSFGMHEAPAVVQYDPMIPVDHVLFSDALFRTLAFEAAPGWVHARLAPQHVSIGPTVGILCSPVWDDKRQTLKNTRQLPGLKKMIEVGEQTEALVYLFGMSDVDFAARTMKAYVHVDGAWKSVVLPFPDAIYDQVISRRVESEPQYLAKRRRLSKMYGPRIFNDGFFDKWEVHDWLTQDRRTRGRVPLTVRFTQSVDLVSFVKRHPVSFLKPLHGSLGLGIVKVSHQQDGTICYEIKQKQGKTTGQVASPAGVVEALRSRLRARPYLIQEGLSLATYEGRPFDVRIVLQRDGRGEWKTTKVFARVARSGEFTSNLSSGGEALPLDTVLAGLYTSEVARRACKRQIKRLSFLVTEVIEERSGKTFGELGIDLGIDQQGQVWVIEVNSKPWKAPTTERGRHELVDLAFARPIHYAIYLAQLK